MSEENKVVARRLYEVIATGNLLLAEEIVDPDAPDNERASVTEGRVQPRLIGTFRQFAADAHAAFPDVQITVEDMIAEGNRVAAHVITRATHRGEFQGIAPTGKQVQVRAMDMFRSPMARSSNTGATATIPATSYASRSACEGLRIHLLGTRVNKGKREARSPQGPRA
jgi:predicted ester cyclase